MTRAIDVNALINEARLSAVQLTVFFLCGALAFFDGYDLQSISYTAPAIAKQWGMSVSSFGPIFSAGIAGLLVGTVGLAYIADRIGRKRCIFFSLIMIGLSTLLMAWAESMTILLALRFVTGLGIGALAPNLMTMSSEYSPKRTRARSVTLMTTSVALGSTLGGLLAARIIPQFGWQVVFYIGGVLALLMIPVVALILPESIRFLVAQGKDRARIVAILSRIAPGTDFSSDRAIVLSEDRPKGQPFVNLFTGGRATKTGLLWLAFMMNQMTVFFSTSWLTSILTEDGLALPDAITAAAMFSGGGIFGPIAVGWLADRFRIERVVCLAYLCGAAMICTIGLSASVLSTAMATAFLAGCCIFGAMGCVISLAAALYPTTMRSTGLGWLSGVGRIGSLLGAGLGGMLIATGLSKAELFYLCSLPPLIAASAIFLFGRTRQSEAQVASPVPAE